MKLVWFGFFVFPWRLERWLAPAVLATLLSGCLFDGVKLPDDYRPRQFGASQPIDHLAIYTAVDPRDTNTTIYTRFIKSARSGYVMEQYMVDDGEVKDRLPFVTHFIPLGDDWYAMHWEMSGEQAYTLAHVSGGQLITSDLTPLRSRIEELGKLADIDFDQSKKALTIQGAPAEKKIIELLKIVSALPQTPQFTMSRTPALPANVVRDSMAAITAIVSPLNARVMEDGRMQPHFVRYFAQLHQDGDGWGSYALARFALNGWGLEQNNDQARDFANIAIKRGVQQAHAILGYLAYFGFGEAANPEKAISHLQLAAAVGEARAYTMLGVAYRDGTGVPQDKFNSKAWLERAVAEAREEAYTILAFELLKENNAGDDLKAIELLDKAMAEKSAYAYYLRGWMHASGRGGATDQTAASMAYLHAAQLGSVNAQRLLGERLITGTGVQAAPEEGKYWLQRAASSGDAQALAAIQQYGLKPLTSFDWGKTGFDTAYAEEQTDWGIAPEYGYTHVPNAPTPSTIPMARVIRTGQLYRYIQQHHEALILDVNSTMPNLSVPGALSVADLGWPLGDANHRQRADAILHKLTAGDKSRPIVFLCSNPKCWLSYNAARYAVSTGYRDVIWYRGGLQAWYDAKLDVEKPKRIDW